VVVEECEMVAREEEEVGTCPVKGNKWAEESVSPAQ
jgi:hypothetical protein